MKQVTTSNLILPEKSLLAQCEGMDTFRVTEFGGHPVPGDGLALDMPAGGLLTVWPDGQYAYEGALQSDDASVNTYFSFVVEFGDGTTTAGSFSLSEQPLVDVMPDFRGWSLDDILALEDDAAMAAGVFEADDGRQGYEAGHHAALDSALHVGGDDLSIDVLEHVIKASCDS